MKKIFLFIMVTTIYVFAWEVTTHRAIDRESIESSSNLGIFITDSGIDKEYKFINEEYEGYDISYKSYIKEGEKGGMSDWDQTFTGEDPIRDIIEAGTILEDALYPYPMNRADGRFNNHFYEAQNGGKKLTLGFGRRTDAVSWATEEYYNFYNYEHAMEYFFKGFAERTKEEPLAYVIQ